MAEPLASGVIGSLIFPRAGSAVARSKGLSRATRSSAQVSLAVNFFSPAPRRHKAPSKQAPVVTAIVGNVLYCQSWACPSSKEWLWYHDGPMRNVLLGELEESKPPRSGARGRRGSKSGHGRAKALASRKESGVQFFRSAYSTSSMSRATPPHMVQTGSSQHGKDQESVASTSSAADIFQEALNLVDTKSMKENLVQYHHVLDKLPTSGVFLSAPFHEVLHLGELLADQVDTLCAEGFEVLTIERWGEYLLGMHATLGKRSASLLSPPDDDRMESLLYRATAFTGHFNASTSYLFAEGGKSSESGAYTRSIYDRILRSHVLALAIHKGIHSAIEYLASHQTRFTCQSRHKAFLLLFEDTTFRRFLTTVSAQHVAAIKKILSSFRPPLQPDLQDRLLSGLGTRQNFSNTPETIAGHPEADTVAAVSPLSNVEIRLLQGDKLPSSPKSVISTAPRWQFNPTSAPEIQRFEMNHPLEPGQTRRSNEDSLILDYDNLFKFLVYRPRPDIHNMLELLRDSVRQGRDYVPDVSTFCKAIQACRKVRNKDGVFIVLKIMKETKVEWNQYMYTTLAAFFSTAMDVKAMQALRERSTRQGIDPGIMFNNSVMYTFGRRGMYNDALKLFRKMESTPGGTMPETYNAMMKVVLLTGAPFNAAMSVFKSMKRKGFAPDHHTYGTLIDGALNYYRVDVAEDLYEELMEMEERTGTKWLNVEIMTSLLSGYLRMGLKEKAQEVLEEMGRRKVRPNAVTYNTILKLQASAADPNQVAASRKLLSTVIENLANIETAKNLRQDPVALLYGPVLVAHMHQGDVDGAEKILDRYIDAGGVPTISLLTTMLTLYRNTQQVDKVIALWPSIFHAAMQQSKTIELDDGEIQTDMALISVPLSIFTQAVSQAGYHAEVMKAWAALMKRGYVSFDEGNWNDFVLACLRAGRVLQAFQAMERFLVPAFMGGHANYRSVRGLQGPSDKSRVERLAELPDAKRMPRPVIGSRHRANVRAAPDMNQSTGDDVDADLELHRVLDPIWYDRRPQRRVFKALQAALWSLEEGLMIRATEVGETSGDVVTHRHPDFRSARSLLDEIEWSCPETLQYIEQTSRRFLIRLPSKSMHDRYRHPWETGRSNKYK